MGTKLKTVSVRLGDQAGARVSKAAQLARQSKGAFLAQAGEEAARTLLLEWAQQRHASGEASLSELAAETGVPVEVIEEHVSGQRSAEATEMYLTSARRLAEALKTPRFYAEARRAVKAAAKGAE
jgi:predicted transcriptional regulator